MTIKGSVSLENLGKLVLWLNDKANGLSHNPSLMPAHILKVVSENGRSADVIVQIDDFYGAEYSGKIVAVMYPKQSLR